MNCKFNILCICITVRCCLLMKNIGVACNKWFLAVFFCNDYRFVCSCPLCNYAVICFIQNLKDCSRKFICIGDILLAYLDLKFGISHYYNGFNFVINNNFAFVRQNKLDIVCICISCRWCYLMKSICLTNF